MKAHLLIFAVVHLIPCWTKPPGKPKAGPSTSKNLNAVPLNKAPDAVDDMYKGCTTKMEKKIEEEYFKKELVGSFKTAWEKTEECSKKAKAPEDEALTKNHMWAICAYTSKYVYKEFNEAVRTGKNIYGSSFKFHYLHYWLTTALQILNKNKKKKDCHTTYRRTKSEFTGKVKDVIRFGTFSSSSYTTGLKKYGSKTCFEIKTCLGADLKRYELFENEEVLIPPYERFKITQIIEGRGKPQGLYDCKKVFVLKSAGDKSNLNCKLANK